MKIGQRAIYALFARSPSIVPAEAIPAASWATQSHYIHYVQVLSEPRPSVLSLSPPRGGGAGTTSSWAGKGAVSLDMLSFVDATDVPKPAPPERPLAFPFIPRMAEWCSPAGVQAAWGSLRKPEDTQKERMTRVAARKMLTNADENYTDPSSFLTNH